MLLLHMPYVLRGRPSGPGIAGYCAARNGRCGWWIASSRSDAGRRPPTCAVGLPAALRTACGALQGLDVAPTDVHGGSIKGARNQLCRRPALPASARFGCWKPSSLGPGAQHRQHGNRAGSALFSCTSTYSIPSDQVGSIQSHLSAVV